MTQVKLSPVVSLSSLNSMESFPTPESTPAGSLQREEISVLREKVEQDRKILDAVIEKAKLPNAEHQTKEALRTAWETFTADDRRLRELNGQDPTA